MRLVYRDSVIVPFSDNARRLFSSWQHGKVEVCLTGGRSKGKTVGLWLYLLGMCQRVPGIQIVVGRTDYALIGKTFLKTLEERIMKYPLGDSNWRHPKNPFFLVGGMNAPKRMVFLNGSEIAFISLKDPEKIRGMECDIFVLNEGTTEKTSASWRAAGGSAAGGRGGHWHVNGKPFRQLITDTNPDVPWHWIYRNFHPDDARPDYVPEDRLWLEYTHFDNPALVDETGKALDAKGLQTIEDLERAYGASGFDADRMIWGKWVAAAGLVYSMFDLNRHVVDMKREDFDADTIWHIGQDHGGGGVRSPFAITLVGQNGNDFRVYKEMGMSNCTIADVIVKLKSNLDLWGVPLSKIDTHVCDDNVPAFNLELREAGFPVVEADKRDKKGIIDSVKQVIRDGRFHVNRNALEERDTYYDGPQGFAQEVLGYAYLPEEEQMLSKNPDIPVEVNNHWMDATGYLIHSLKDSEHLPRRTGFVARFGRR